MRPFCKRRTVALVMLTSLFTYAFGIVNPVMSQIFTDRLITRKNSEIRRSVMTGSLAVVDQDITLFEDTIANNIKMWDDSIKSFDMILAASDAQIHDEIILTEDGDEA